MTWHIVCLAGESDKFTPKLKEGDGTLVVPFDVPGHVDSIQTSVPEVLARHGLKPPPTASDFLNAAVGAYTADVRVPRKGAYDGWTRDFVLHLPVRSHQGWGDGRRTLERLLSFLTGDHWTVEVRQAPKGYAPAEAPPPRVVQPLDAESVCLFSGGLDSFVGAADVVENGGRQVALIGHHSAGGGATSRSQSLAISALREEYDEGLTPFLQLWVSPPKGQSRASEITTRGRSIIFLGLGVAVASALGAHRLVVPENGLISLNVPLTNARLGSFSTRTTHPFLMSLLRQLLAGIGLGVAVELPYRFRTKGEMLTGCANQDVVPLGLKATMSCSHPGANRFAAKNPNLHCGYCVPCIIRRAAVRATGKRDPTDYYVKDLGQPLSPKRGADLRSLRIALDRYGKRAPRLADVLSSGPLPVSDDELREYSGVYRRGVDEVRGLLSRYR
jgi:7-cyano-7-deazaguanine synthase in queuosine biosynthesis